MLNVMDINDLEKKKQILSQYNYDPYHSCYGVGQ